VFGSFYISRGFFLILAIIVGLLMVSFDVPFLFQVSQIGLMSLLVFLVLDILILFSTKTPVVVERSVETRMNLGDAHTVNISVTSKSPQPYFITVYDEAPLEMQARDMRFTGTLSPKSTLDFSYSFVPKKRGAYKWGNTHVFMRSLLSLVKRRIIISNETQANVYPSVMQMKKYAFEVFHHQSQQKGIKKIRRLGQNNEFEQIKNYVQGDELRTLNWKATSRRNELMVNQYQEERSQNIYAIIDKSRAMAHSFDGMTLLDYAINSTLVFSNIALRKGDKPGVFTFSDKIGSKLAANSGQRQLQLIMDLLYNERTHFNEANFDLLFQVIRQNIRTRSLLMLYTNFDTEQAMRRALPLLKRLARTHLLVVIFFENTNLQEVVIEKPATERDVYLSAVAEDVINIKKRIALELNRNGIHAVLSKPDDLSVHTINKYLEFKSRGLI
jgi:uncharacterized protein (DUF58 family)